MGQIALSAPPNDDYRPAGCDSRGVARMPTIAMKPRTLIVSTASNDLALASTALELAGYDVSLVVGVQQALATISTDIPDLILVDISGSDPDGPALMPLLKPDPRLHDVPVVALAAAGGPLHAELSHHPRYRHSIVKPLAREDT